LDHFCSCDLDHDPMTSIYESDPYLLEIYRMCENELSTSRLSKVIVLQRVRQIDRQMPSILYTTPLHGWSIIIIVVPALETQTLEVIMH